MRLLQKYLTGVATATTVALLSFSAVAADLGGSLKDDPYTPPFTPPFSWTGVYVGAQVGYMWGKADHSYSDWAPSGNSDSNGWIGGVHTGYNMQAGNVVYGIEADFEGGNISGNFTNLTGLTSSGSVDLNWQGSLRARVGYATGKALLYVTGGWAFGDFDFNGGRPAVGFASSYSETRHGWTIGTGGEFAISNNVTMRLEYRYTDFGKASGNLFSGVRMPVDLDTHAVRAGISYKF